MLKQLTIHNYLLVDDLEVSFDSGLTGITGESGAGKSILLGALGMLLGERARSDSVRPGSSKADISAEFTLSPGSDLQARLIEDELIEDGDESCLIRRVISAEGRSKAFINNIPITQQYLKKVGEQLVDVQDQNEHLRLVDRHVQRTLLDDFAGLKAQAAEVRERHRTWQQSVSEIERLSQELANQEDRKNLLTYQLEEFDQAAIGANELAHLEQEQRRLAQAQTILNTIEQAQQQLESLDPLRQSHRLVMEIDDEHPVLKAAQETLASALTLLDDGARDLRHYQEQVVVDPASLAEVEARLGLFMDLSRKHRVAPDQLSRHADGLREELDSMTADTSRLDQLVTDEKQQHQAYRRQAERLAADRRAAAIPFAQEVSQHLKALSMAEGELLLAFNEQENEHGLEQVEFQVTTNSKFAPGPLGKIASGGEQTRISLAIQMVAAAKSDLPCLVLDEADVGVGGTTADTIGRILRSLAEHTQVLCVTHAPQVAALANHHLCVIKEGASTQIMGLYPEQRIDELARMLAGADVTDKTRAYAQTLLEEASAE